ncbi:MAG TPA: hypothetical protein VK550_03915 [Polyangiaceae bacterium]|nr:hypothetical protein [Polyangiaceae bacterium]
MSTSRRSLAAALGLLATIAVILFASQETRATHVDPTAPVTIVVGPAPGHSPMGRVDGARRGRARDPLPDHPQILWRHAPLGALDFAPLAVDSQGAVVAAGAGLPHVIQLTRDGAEQWRGRTGIGPSVTGSVILSDDTRAVVTSAGDLVSFYPNGRTRFMIALELPERNAHFSLLPLDDGGLAVAGGHDVDELDDDGRRRDRTHLTERISGPLVATRFGIIATTAAGSVFTMRGGFAKRLGSLGGDPGEPGASSPDGRSLLAVVDHQRLVAFDLTSGNVETVHAVSDQSLHGPVVLGADDARVLVTWNGVLTRIGRAPGDIRRTPLDLRAETLVTDAGKVDFAQLDESPPPLTDAEGRIGFARVGGRVGVVAADGRMQLVVGSTCISPAALAPAGPRRMVVGCRDGTVVMIGESRP